MTSGILLVLSMLSLFAGGIVDGSLVFLAAWFHARGTVGGDRHYWGFGGAAVARGANGPRIGAADELLEQLEADWTGVTQLSRYLSAFSAGRTELWLVFESAAGNRAPTKQDSQCERAGDDAALL